MRMEKEWRGRGQASEGVTLHLCIARCSPQGTCVNPGSLPKSKNRNCAPKQATKTTTATKSVPATAKARRTPRERQPTKRKPTPERATLQDALRSTPRATTLQRQAAPAATPPSSTQATRLESSDAPT